MESEKIKLLTKKLFNRVLVNGVLWICIGGIQIIYAFILAIMAAYNTNSYFSYLMYSGNYAILGIINLIFAINELQKGKKVKNNTENLITVVDCYRFSFITFIFYTYNILVCVAYITSGSIIFGLLALLGFFAICFDFIFLRLFSVFNRDLINELRKLSEKQSEQATKETELKVEDKWNQLLENVNIPPIDKDSDIYRRYSNYSKEDLIEILENQTDYREECIIIAEKVYIENFLHNASGKLNSEYDEGMPEK